MLGECLFEERDHTRIHLDCGHRPDPSGEGGGQDARPRPHLEDIVRRRELGSIDDRSEHGAVDEEALPERGRRPDAVTAQDLAKPARVRDVHRGRG